MICPKCKKDISDNSLTCTYCNTKVGALCSDCGSYNQITATECQSCGKILLKICQECGSANLPKAKSCRKCNKDFNDSQNKNIVRQPVYTTNMSSQQNIKTRLIEALKSIAPNIITLCGDSGIGKSLILRHAINELKSTKLIWLSGTCTQISQLSPFGYFQDLLLTFFNINNFCPDTLQLKKDSLRFFKEDFPTLTNSEILDLLNFLYPDNLDKYENIYYNKAKMFTTIKKVIFTIAEKTKIIFIVDNFDFIDGMSYDFIKELFNEEFIKERCKILITMQNPRPGLGILPLSLYNEDSYLDLTIAPFTETQAEAFLKQYKDLKFNKDFTKTALKISNGNPAIIEQIVLLDREIQQNGLKNIHYNTFENVIKIRLGLLKQDMNAYRLLVAMSVLGEKFYPAILTNFDNYTIEEYERCVEKLVNTGFITQLTNLSYEFKTSDLWKHIMAIVKNEDCFENILNILYETLSLYRQSSIALLGYIVQKLSNNDQAFEIWTLLMKQASYIGDIGLYIITQKQALKLIENKTSDFYQTVKRNIYIRVGKLLEPIDHSSAFEYIQNAIMLLEDYQDEEHIELLGYLASCSMKSGNYWGAIECIENVLNKLPDTMSFSKILVKSKLVRPLLKLGNYGQLINLVETEILPEIEKVISRGRNLPTIKIKDLYKIWLDIYFDFAEALILQGDNKAFAIIQNIYDVLDKNQTTDAILICKANLLLALANTIKGDIKVSTKVLDDILKDYQLNEMDSYIVSRWNFIDILNKFFLKEYNTLHSELFNVAAYANNANDAFTKNVLKTLLAQILKSNNQTKKALEILEEQVAYFAKEKVATGVLLSWYLIAKIKLITSGTQFALDIATKALDIAQSSNINNYYFIALFNKLIGEIYLAKQDFESAKVYLEKSIFISKQFDLEFILVKVYIQCAKLYQELALPKSASRNEYIKQALKMFQLAKNVPCVTEQPALQKNIKDELAILTSFCKLNGILLKKETK